MKSRNPIIINDTILTNFLLGMPESMNLKQKTENFSSFPKSKCLFIFVFLYFIRLLRELLIIFFMRSLHSIVN